MFRKNYKCTVKPEYRQYSWWNITKILQLSNTLFLSWKDNLFPKTFCYRVICRILAGQLPGEKPKSDKYCVPSSAILTGCGCEFRQNILFFPLVMGVMGGCILLCLRLWNQEYGPYWAVFQANWRESPLKTWRARGSKKEENKTGNQQIIGLNHLLKSKHFYH